MKTLKIKSKISTLLIVLLASVTLISCSKDELSEIEVNQNVSESTQKSSYSEDIVLRDGFNDEISPKEPKKDALFELSDRKNAEDGKDSTL